MDKVQVAVVDQAHRASGARHAAHTSLLLLNAAQRIRVRTPMPRNGSGGLREGIPVTARMSFNRPESAPTAMSASSVPEMVPHAAPTPLSQAVA
ncbi:hypothetical protein D3C80_1887300 [compost metagenome]